MAAARPVRLGFVSYPPPPSHGDLMQMEVRAKRVMPLVQSAPLPSVLSQNGSSASDMCCSLCGPQPQERVQLAETTDGPTVRWHWCGLQRFVDFTDGSLGMRIVEADEETVRAEVGNASYSTRSAALNS